MSKHKKNLKKDLKIEFHVIDAFEIANYEPIWRSLRQMEVDARIVVVPNEKSHLRDKKWFDFDRAVKYIKERNIPLITKADFSAIGITTQNGEVVEPYKQPHIRLMYGPSVFPTAWGTSEKAARPFDAILVHGPYYQKLISEWKKVDQLPIIGYPRYDDLFSGKLKNVEIRKSWKLDNNKPLILYLPTWAHNSTFEKFFETISKLQSEYQVVVKPHHCTVRFEPERMQALKNSGVLIATDPFDLPKWLAVADVILADTRSSAMTESLIAGKRTIGLVQDEKEFAEWIYSSDLPKSIPLISHPQEIPKEIQNIIKKDILDAERINWVNHHVSYRDGSSSYRTALAILQIIAEEKNHPYRAIYRKIKFEVKKRSGLNRLKRIYRKLRVFAKKLLFALTHPFRLYHKIVEIIRSIFPRNRKNTILNSFNAALMWIKNNSIDQKGIQLSNLHKDSYPEVTGYIIPTLLSWGEKDRAIQFADYLVSIQNPDGSWNAPQCKIAYTFDTGQILKGLLSLVDIRPEYKQNILKGCDWILTQQRSDGSISTPDYSVWSLPNDKRVPEAIHLYALLPIRTAGKKWNIPKYNECVNKALNFYLKKNDLTDFNTLSHFHAYIIEALIDLGETKRAEQAMINLSAYQNRNGSVPAYQDAKFVCSTGLFQYAICWYKLNELEKGNKAFSYALKLQNRSGGWFGSYGWKANYFQNQEISWAVKYFLDALYWKIRCEFNMTAQIFPSYVDENDGRYSLIENVLRKNNYKTVIDIGCGKGRFISKLLERNPEIKPFGVDISDEILKSVEPKIVTKQGSLLSIPYPDSTFDLSYCIEALEHAVNIEGAIREMARVTKKGGTLVIIDKNINKLGSMALSEWETWFDAQELTNKMTDKNLTVSIFENLSYNKNKADDLFIGWVGKKI